MRADRRRHRLLLGANDRGQLGNGVDLHGVVQVLDLYRGGRAERFGHACALRATGQVVCWGNDQQGQIGDETVHPQCSDTFIYGCAREPVLVEGITNAVTISLGALHSCALLQNGDVACWGHNGLGQLGIGDFKDRRTPVIVVDL